MDARKVVGNNVRKQRLAANLTQAELATRMGVDRAYVSGLEQGQRNPTIVTVWHVAKALAAPMASLFDEVSGPVAQGKRAPKGRKAARK